VFNEKGRAMILPPRHVKLGMEFFEGGDVKESDVGGK